MKLLLLFSMDELLFSVNELLFSVDELLLSMDELLLSMDALLLCTEKVAYSSCDAVVAEDATAWLGSGVVVSLVPRLSAVVVWPGCGGC